MALRITRTRTTANTVTAELSVSCKVVSGVVTREALAAWVEEAVAHYHRFRAGHVGVAASAGITKPRVINVRDKT